MKQQWEVVIGIETHVQLLTRSKIFSGSSTAFGAPPNTQANVIDLAMPGVLPVLNKGAVECAIRFGLAVEGEVAARGNLHPGRSAGCDGAVSELIQRPALIIAQCERPACARNIAPCIAGQTAQCSRSADNAEPVATQVNCGQCAAHISRRSSDANGRDCRARPHPKLRGDQVFAVREHTGRGRVSVWREAQNLVHTTPPDCTANGAPPQAW